jgi:hypothetical protein
MASAGFGMVAEKAMSCLSLMVAFITALTFSILFSSINLSASSSMMVFTVWAEIFLFLISSSILPEEPTIIWGRVLSFSTCLSIFTFPMIAAPFNLMSEF